MLGRALEQNTQHDSICHVEMPITLHLVTCHSLEGTTVTKV